MDITHLRLQNQYISDATFKKPSEVVGWFGAIQAQDYLSSLWAIGLRMQHATEATIEQAIAEKTIVRTWPMRGTIHYVPAVDVRWMLKLLTPRILARNAKRLLQNYSLNKAILARSKNLILKALQGGRQLTRSAMYQVLEEGHISTTSQRGLQILWWLAQEGLICFGPRQGKQPTFVLLDEWLPATKMLSHDEALAELARRYFTSHGPATMHDFAWWSGLTMAEAARGFETVKSQFLREVIGEQVYWLPPLEATAQDASAAVYLLPILDEYTVAYKDRSAVLDSTYTAQTRNGALESNVILNGRIAGTWKRILKGGEVVITVKLFTPLTKAQNESLSEAEKRYRAFLGLPVVLAQ